MHGLLVLQPGELNELEDPYEDTVVQVRHFFALESLAHSSDSSDISTCVLAV